MAKAQNAYNGKTIALLIGIKGFMTRSVNLVGTNIPKSAEPVTRSAVITSVLKNMAITAMANRSSTIAKASRNCLEPFGILLPNKAKTAIAKVASVAIGITQPELAIGSSLVTRKYKPAGTKAPKTAANPGTKRALFLANTPCVISVLSSKPIMKKKRAKANSEM